MLFGDRSNIGKSFGINSQQLTDLGLQVHLRMDQAQRLLPTPRSRYKTRIGPTPLKALSDFGQRAETVQQTLIVLASGALGG